MEWWWWSTTWRPSSFPDSIDGKPLVTTVAELSYHNFPYERLPSSTPAALFLRPAVVFALLAVYLGSIRPLRALRAKVRLPPRVGQCGVAGHNGALAVFSAVCAYHSWRVVAEHSAQFGWFAVYCDPDGRLWHSGLGAWSFVFYLSKYYEFVDTWILVLKGKPASVLQVYHHTGIALIMWCAVASQSAWLLFVVLLNSVIHTVMYTYFFIKTVSPNTQIQAARYLTTAQIVQFFTGLACTVPVFVLGRDCDTESSRFALACLHLYGYGLIALFFAFAQRKYKKSADKEL